MLNLVSWSQALCYTHGMVENNALQSLIDGIRARGWQGAGQAVLDVIEPVAPIIAQLLLVFQPVSRIFGGSTLISELVSTLDSPDGVKQLREQLNTDSANIQATLVDDGSKREI